MASFCKAEWPLGGRQIYKQANKPDNFRVTATTKETKWNNVRGGQGTTLK